MALTVKNSRSVKRAILLVFFYLQSGYFWIPNKLMFSVPIFLNTQSLNTAYMYKSTKKMWLEACDPTPGTIGGIENVIFFSLKVGYSQNFIRLSFLAAVV